MRVKAVIILIGVLAVAPLISACANFDPDDLDVFHLNEKKKLPGERKPVFPEGVPGGAGGVPAELVKGYQPPPEPAIVAEPAPAAKPKPRVVTRSAPKPAPTRITVQPSSKVPPATAEQGPPPMQPVAQPASQPQPNWPAPQASQQNGAQTPWPAAAPQSSPWPAAPPPGTFQR